MSKSTKSKKPRTPMTKVAAARIKKTQAGKTGGSTPQDSFASRAERAAEINDQAK